MLELDKTVFDGFVVDSLDIAHMLYDEELDIVRRHVKNINELNADLVKTRCNTEVLNMYEKFVGTFYSALKTLYRIEGQAKPDWLTMDICEEYAVKLRDAVRAKVGRND